MLQFQRQRQRIPRSAKTKQWKLDNMKYFLGQAQNYWRAENKRMYLNYQFYHNILDQEEMGRYCDPLVRAGLEPSSIRDTVHAFNKAPTKVDVLMGEERDRPWKYYVVSPSPVVTNQIIREKTRATREYLEFQLMKEAEMVRTQMMLKAGVDSGEMTEEQAAQIQEQINAEMQELESVIMDPEKIKLTYTNHKTLSEQTMYKLLKIAEAEQKLKNKKNDSLLHGTLAGLELILVNVVQNKLNVEILNPVGVAFHKSPDEPWIERGDWVVIRKELTMGAILDHYGRYLSNEEIRKLENALGSVYGLDTPYASKTGKSVDSFTNRYNPLYRGTGTWWEGLHGQPLSDEQTYTVDTAYWRSQKEMYYLQIVNEAGESREEYVSENYPIPKDAEKVSFTDEEDVKVTQLIWFDEATQSQFIAEKIWVDEIFEGTCIDEHIYLNMRPYRYALVNPEDPTDVFLPVFGTIYGGVNAPITSVMDRMMPWAKLYILVFNHMLELIMKDYGRVFSLNNLMIDGDIGVHKTIQYMIKIGILPNNPLANQEVAGSAIHSMKLGEAVDLGNTDKIVHYLNILNFLEAQIGDSIGVQKPREGVTGTSQSVTNAQQDLVQQNKVTRLLFAKHDLIWENVLNGAIRTLQLLYADGEVQYLRNALSDEEIAILELDPKQLGALTYLARVMDSAQLQQAVETIKMNLQAMLQNDRIQTSTLFEMLMRDDPSEIRNELTKMEKQFAQQQQELQQMQGERAAQIQAQTKQAELDQRLQELAYQRETDMMLKDKELDVKARITDATGEQQMQLAVENNDIKLEDTRLKIQAQKEIASEKNKTDLKTTTMDNETQLEQTKLQGTNALKVAKAKPKTPKK